jgi:hypothetical protein
LTKDENVQYAQVSCVCLFSSFLVICLLLVCCFCELTKDKNVQYAQVRVA